jgi:hypothetical protein
METIAVENVAWERVPAASIISVKESSALKVEAAGISEMLVPVYQFI